MCCFIGILSSTLCFDAAANTAPPASSSSKPLSLDSNTNQPSTIDPDLTHSLYYEQYDRNFFMGYMPTLGYQLNENATIYGKLFIDLRIGELDSSSTQKSRQKLGTANFGGQFSFGQQVNMELGFGIDILELIANEILKPNKEEDSDVEQEDVVDIDGYLSLGANYQINKAFSIGVYSKLNFLSGHLIKDHSAVYYGTKLTIAR